MGSMTLRDRRNMGYSTDERLMSMEFQLGPSGIRFNDCFFTEPVDLNSWTPPKCAGLFGILVSDPNWAPKAFQPLYFGEFGHNLPASALLHECNHVKAASSGKQLFVSVLLMPFSTTQNRWALRNELVWAYNPILQTEADTTRRPELTKPAEQAIPTPRRQFGFVPNTAS
jgi:hypothetical protein